MSKSVGKIFTSFLLKILFAVLIVAFGAWGVADMLKRSPEHQAVIKVGDVEVDGRQVKRAFATELKRIRDQFGPQVTAADAQKYGIFDQVLSQLATRALLDAAAKDMNVGVSDEAVQALITGNSAFQDQNGNFSPERFRRVLDNNGYHEADFLSGTRSDMIRQRVLDSVRGPVVTPKILVDTLLRYEGERRTAETFLVEAKAMPQPADPGDEALQAFQKDHAEAYTAPETRKLTVLALRPDDVKIEISADALKTYYEQHAADFAEPEQRKLSQILLRDEATAAKAAAALNEGRKPDAVAKEVGGALTDLGWVARDGLLSSIGDPAFAAKAGAILPPLKSPLGWHVVLVEAVRPAHQASFDEARARIETAVRTEESLGALYRLSTAVEDSLAAGATLEEAAKTNKLAVHVLDGVDAEGAGADPKATSDLPALAEAVKAGFGQEAGAVSPLMEYEGEPGGYFIVRTDAVTPAALKPFAQVRAEVLAAWRAQEQIKAAVAKAEELAKGFAEAKDAAAFAKANGVKLETTPDLYRSQGANLPQALLAKIFAVEPGEAASAPAPGGAMVAKLKAIEPVDPKVFEAGLEQGKRQLRGALGDSLLAPFTTQLADSFKMKQYRSVDSLVQEIR